MDDVPNHKFPRNDFVCEDMLPSEHTASNALRYRADEESTFADSDVTYCPEMPVLNSQDEQHASCQQALVNNFGAIFSTLPRSFTELLFNSDHEPPKAQEDIDHKSEISRYMLDSSLHVMLTKMEQVIGELGGDLTLI